MNKLGISPVVSTAILTSVLMAVTIAAAMVSYDVLRGHMAETEFKVVEDSYVELAKLMNRDVWVGNATHSVTFRCRFGGPMVVVTSDNLTVGVESPVEDFEPLNLTTITNITWVGYKNRYTTVVERNLVGNRSLIVNGDVVVSVYTGHLGETLIRLDGLRVGVVNAGNISLNGENWNYVVLRVVKLTRGLTAGVEVFTVRWTTTNVSALTVLINKSISNLTVVAYHTFFGQYGQILGRVEKKTIQLNPGAKGTVITLVMAKARIDVA